MGKGTPDPYETDTRSHEKDIPPEEQIPRLLQLIEYVKAGKREIRVMAVTSSDRDSETLIINTAKVKS